VSLILTNIDLVTGLQGRSRPTDRCPTPLRQRACALTTAASIQRELHQAKDRQRFFACSPCTRLASLRRADFARIAGSLFTALAPHSSVGRGASFLSEHCEVRRRPRQGNKTEAHGISQIFFGVFITIPARPDSRDTGRRCHRAWAPPVA
jgi:hypothetical protein